MFDTKKVHINSIKPGDMVFHEGKTCTVGEENLKRNGFMGTTLFGDSYRLGTLPVFKVVEEQPLIPASH